MTDFEHKSGKDNAKQPLGSDPMLELTRLFGSRPRPVSARVSYGGESQDTSAFPPYDGMQDPDFFAQNSPEGLSEGSIEMSGQVNQGGQPGGRRPQEEQWYEDDNSLPPYHGEDASPDFVDSSPIHETQWTGSGADPDWEDDPAPITPSGFEEGGGTHGVPLDGNHGMMAPPSFVSPTMPSSAPPTPTPPAQAQKPVLQPSEISNISFGYGHSVQIKPRVFSPPPPPEPEMRRADPLGSGEADQMQNTPHQASGQAGLNEALHDFDLTISNGRRHYRQPSPSSQGQPQPLHPRPMVDPAAATVPIGAGHIEATDNFDLPPVAYEGQDGFGTAGGGEHSPPPLSPVAAQEVPPPVPPLPRVEPDPAIIYDWGAPKTAKSAKVGGAAAKGVSRGLKRFYGFVVILLLFAIGVGGYFVFETYRSGEGGPVTITADPEDVRIVPQQSDEIPSSSSEAGVYDGAEANGGQGTLLDGRETPLNLEQINEQPPLSNESSLEPRTVEDSILHALSRAIPVHLVPTVIMSRDGEGNLVDVSPNNNAPEIIVRPGADYSASIANARAMQSAQPPTGAGEDQPAQQTEIAVTDAARNITDTPATSPDDMPLRDVQEARLPSTAQSQDSVAQDDGITTGRDSGNAVSGEGNGMIPTTRGQIDTPPPATIPDKPRMPDSPPPLRVAENANTATPAVSPPARTAEAPPPTGNVAAAGGEGDFYVQIASQPTQAAAQQSADEAKRQFASLIGGRRVLIVPADIPGRGTYYRVRVATGERSAAVNLCEQYKQAGGSCFIGR